MAKRPKKPVAEGCHTGKGLLDLHGKSGPYVKVFTEGRSEYAVQIWDSGKPEGEPDHDWAMPKELGLTGCIHQSILQSKPSIADLPKPKTPHLDALRVKRDDPHEIAKRCVNSIMCDLADRPCFDEKAWEFAAEEGTQEEMLQEWRNIIAVELGGKYVRQRDI